MPVRAPFDYHREFSPICLPTSPLRIRSLALPWTSMLPNLSLSYLVILSEAKNLCTGPPWKSGPSGPRQSDRAERGFSPRVLLTGPAEPRQPPVSFTLSS